MSQAFPPEKSGQPGSKALPTRSTTLSSNGDGYISDENAVPEYDTNDTVGLLTERLQAWKHACGYLENYVHGAEKMEKNQSKEYDKMLKSIKDPLREGHQFDQSLGGVAGLFDKLRSDTQGLSNSHAEASKNLHGTVLPILERLHAEIKSKTKEVEGGAGKRAKAVASARNSSQKHIELLGQYTAIHDSANSKIDAQHDPYVLHRGTQHRLHKQVMEENNSRDDFVALQDNFKDFEGHVIRTFQQAFQSFYQIMSGDVERQKSMYGDMLGSVQRIAPDFEWTKFVERSGPLLVDRKAPQREVQHIQYPNEDHASTKPLIQGTLERKSRGVGAITGYKTGFYAVTKAKYLHQFESDDNYRKDPTPELSLYLPDCTIGAVSDTKFNIKGKDVSKGKVGMAFALTYELAFKAHTAADAKEWHRIISECIGTKTEEVPSSTITSPVNEDDGHKQKALEEASEEKIKEETEEKGEGTTEEKQPPPLDTDVKGQASSSETPVTAGTDASKTPATPAVEKTASPEKEEADKETKV